MGAAGRTLEEQVHDLGRVGGWAPGGYAGALRRDCGKPMSDHAPMACQCLPCAVRQALRRRPRRGSVLDPRRAAAGGEQAPHLQRLRLRRPHAGSARPLVRLGQQGMARARFPSNGMGQRRAGDVGDVGQGGRDLPHLRAKDGRYSLWPSCSQSPSSPHAGPGRLRGAASGVSLPRDCRTSTGILVLLFAD